MTPFYSAHTTFHIKSSIVTVTIWYRFRVIWRWRIRDLEIYARGHSPCEFRHDLYRPILINPQTPDYLSAALILWVNVDSDVSMWTHVSGTVSGFFALYTSCAALVSRRNERRTTVAGRLAGAVVPGLWQRVARRGLPGNQLDRLQSVMNDAARLVCSTWEHKHIRSFLWLWLLCICHWVFYEHISQPLRDLH